MLSQFRVDGLHGHRNFLVTIKDDRLIVVGENGTGKSTLANLIYYFITCQWARLAEYRFDNVSAVLNGTLIKITHAMLEKHQENRLRFSRNLPPQIMRTLRARYADQQLSLIFEDDEELRRLSAEWSLPTSYLRKALHDIKLENDDDEIVMIGKTIKAMLPGQVLYLPTYRRIEQDLKSIFRGIDLEEQLSRLREQIGQGRRRGGYVELVEFGMQDVDATVKTRLTAVKDSLREGLSNLTATYLRDVIRGIHAKADATSVLALDLENLDAMLSRLDEATLPAEDKRTLRERVVEMQKRAVVAAGDSVVVHFLSKLLELQQAQQQQESVLEKFVSTCNRYLVGKAMHFDNAEYRLYIRRNDSEVGGDTEVQNLAFKHLSSGEKQIVSLFAHMYLSGRTGFYVIIDEPELSLSVPWQRHFLPDILGTGLCSGLLAVTHSPFIWENEFEGDVRSMAEFAEAARVAG